MSERSAETMTPWRESAITQVWNVTEKARADVGTEHPSDDASLAVWFVHAPWMHIAWSWHYADLIHLRDLPGQTKSPTRTVEGASHEFMVYAIHPDYPPKLNAPKLEPPTLLSPVSIVQQFIAANDAEALQRIEEGLALAVDGNLTLDSDGRRAWERLLLTSTA